MVGGLERLALSVGEIAERTLRKRLDPFNRAVEFAFRAQLRRGEGVLEVCDERPDFASGATSTTTTRLPPAAARIERTFVPCSISAEGTDSPISVTSKSAPSPSARSLTCPAAAILVVSVASSYSRSTALAR